MKQDFETFILKKYKTIVDGSKSLSMSIADFISNELAYRVMKYNLNVDEWLLTGLDFSAEQLFWIASVQVFCHVNRGEKNLQKLSQALIFIEPTTRYTLMTTF